METPKKPAKKASASKGPVKKTIEKPTPPKPKNRFIDDDEDDEFDEPIDDLGGFDQFEGLEEEEDY